MSLLWSPSADTACDNLMTVSRMLAPCPRRLGGSGVDELTERADTARLVGLQQFCYPLELDADVVPLDRHRGAVLRYDGAVLHRRASRVGRRQLDGPTRYQLRRQDRSFDVGRHFVVAIE